MGKKHITPPKFVVTKIKNLHLVFLGTCGHRILDNFCSFQIHLIRFKLKFIYLKKNPTNIYKLKHMKYICVKINTPQSMKICKYISKLKLRVEFCNEFFVLNDIYIHQLNL
jgi:hypothetical protein